MFWTRPNQHRGKLHRPPHAYERDGTQDNASAAGELRGRSEDLLSVSTQRVGMGGGAPSRFRRRSRETPATIQKRMWSVSSVKRSTELKRSPSRRLEIPALR